MRFMVDRCGLRLDDALRCASTVPARLLGESDIGVIRQGAKGDLVALDDALHIAAVWVRGQQVV